MDYWDWILDPTEENNYGFNLGKMVLIEVLILIEG